MKSFALATALLAVPTLLLADCPAAPDHSAAIAETLDRIQAAEREMDARLLSNQLWEYWTDAPDEAAQELLDSAMRARESYDYLRARDALDRLVAYCPDYAEGYNQRAFVSFLTQNFEAALPDLDRVLALSPNHVAAMSGKALTLMGLGRDADAQEVLRAAVALNPWLSERHLLTEPPGEDI
ncbi:Tetratricopeptide repeat protein [Roseivivax sp. THAF40]|uniref:tetratricopeptide repeat protein n=1 Tax=unclassified Roseivivax TaxID=2639302 RepID=UPI0012678CC5|nr:MULTISPECIES: tetratricopeptide repeat protein [unclassified Roseivivax]QFS81667.1 Tetratricopeptide repeat protein [Roseivivax sp. THAF197b]QFT45459.1 Tetratricopeptide repeat protein [Roseivivax sp. THAF40]